MSMSGRTLRILSAALMAVALITVVGVVVAGARVGWDLTAFVSIDYGRGGSYSLGFAIPVFAVVATVSAAGSLALARIARER